MTLEGDLEINEISKKPIFKNGDRFHGKTEAYKYDPDKGNVNLEKFIKIFT